MRLIDADELAKKAEWVAEMWKKSLENPKNEREESDLSKELHLFNAVFAFAKDCPTVDPVKHGRWIHGSSSENIRVTCSECGYKVNYFWDSWQDAKYCPHCGAKMDGKEE